MRSALAVFLAAALWTFQLRGDWRITALVGGAISAVAAHGSLAFVGVGSRLHIFDISDPTSPREVGSTRSFGDNVSHIFVDATRAYVVAGTDGVHVVDLSDSAMPRVLGQWDSPGSAEGIAIQGTLLYVADGPFGLAVVDVANPAIPTAVASAFDIHFAFDVVIHDHFAFVAAADAGVVVVDIAGRGARVVGRLETPGYARDLAIDGSTLYVADQWGGVRVVDIAQPLSPREIAAVTLPSWAFAIGVSQKILYVAAGARGLHAFDVTNATQPRAVGSYAIPLKTSWKIAVADGRALVGVRTEGVHIVAMPQPMAMQRAGIIAPLVSASAVAVSGGFAYALTGDQGMRVVDLTGGGQPRERGGGPTLQGLVGGIEAADQKYVYVGSGIQGRHQLDVFDVTDADRPVLTRSVKLFNFARELVLRGSQLYVPNEFGLEVFDLTNPAEPVLAGRITFPDIAEAGGATSVAVAGSHAFVSAGRSGVKVVDISNPANMQIVGAFTLGQGEGATIFQLAHRDGYLYATAGPGLMVLDVRDPRQPVLIASVGLSGVFTGDILVDGPHAYVANGSAGVAVIDIRDPARPSNVAQVPVGGFALELAAKDDQLLVAASTGGLVFIKEVQQSAIASAPIAPAWTIRATPSAIFPAPAFSENHRVATARLASKAQRSVVVTSPGDSGPGTLREALTNLAAGDVLTFDPTVFPPNAPTTIRVATVLPLIRASDVTIDASNAGVILDGSLLSGDFESGLEIEESSKNNIIRGMQIVNFPSAGIYVNGGGGNLIGGDRRRGAGPVGEGNVVSRNRKFGIHVDSPNNNRIVGNLIGTDVTGRVGLGRQMFGVDVFPPPSGQFGTDRIGGHEPWEANVIAGNSFADISLHNGGGHSVIGNFVGTDVSGNRVGDSVVGVSISASSDNLITDNVIVARNAMAVADQGACCNRVINNYFGVTRDLRIIPREIEGEDGVRVNESFNLIYGNVFGGLQSAAVRPSGLVDAVIETIIAGNTFLGLSATRGIFGGAIDVNASSRTFIGGSTPSFGNQINAGAIGIQLRDGVDRTFVMGNSIGNDDTTSLQNVDGIDVGTSIHTFIQHNTIANNTGKAVVVGAAKNRIRENSIYGNRRGAIEVRPGAGVPAPPVITAVTLTTVTGTSCAGCTIEIFSDGETQARWYDGTTIADASGHFSFTRRILRGARIAATATDTAGSTSELSLPFTAPPAPPRRRAVRR